ncbi:hypothetical protein ABSA28_00354 [Candidatus Hepatincolaceae symbiont of Richtersius coronifer]
MEDPLQYFESPNFRLAPQFTGALLTTVVDFNNRTYLGAKSSMLPIYFCSSDRMISLY